MHFIFLALKRKAARMAQNGHFSKKLAIPEQWELDYRSSKRNRSLTYWQARTGTGTAPERGKPEKCEFATFLQLVDYWNPQKRRNSV